MKTNTIILTISLAALLFSCGKKTEETTPIRKDVNESVFASGVLEADGFYQLTAQSNGYITKLNFDEGNIVQRNATLAEIEDTETPINLEGASQLLEIAKFNAADSGPLLQQAKYNIAIAKEKMTQDQKTADRYKRLWESNSIAKVDYENALLAFTTSKNNYEIALKTYEKQKSDANQQVVSNKTTSELFKTAKGKTFIKAVISGKVYKKLKEVGDYVRQGDVIAEIGSPNEIYALVNIDESNIAKIKIGQKAVIKLNVSSTVNYKGRVSEILPTFDEATQSFLCKLYFTDSLDFKIINTQLQCNIMIGGEDRALLIPRNYVDYGGYVQVKGEEEKRKIETKFVSSEWVQVLSGIDENSVLVTDNLKQNN